MELIVLGLGGVLLLVALGSYWDTTARVRRVERKLNALLRHHGVDPALGLLMSDRVKQMARDPKRMSDAIRLYCEETGTGVAEAKEAIDAYVNSM